MDPGDGSMDGWAWSLQGRVTNTETITQQINYALVNRGLSYESEGTNRNVPVNFGTVAERDAASGPAGTTNYSLASANLLGGTENLLTGTGNHASADAPFGIQGGYIFSAVLQAGGTVCRRAARARKMRPLDPGARSAPVARSATNQRRGENMPNDSITSVPSIGTSPGARPARVGDGLMAKLGALLSKALEDVSSIEVRTFTSEAADSGLAASGDPLVANTRLRAFTRVAVDGDTQICVPLRASGEPDEALWKLHAEAVAGARDDRAKAIAAAIAIVKELGGSIR